MSLRPNHRGRVRLMEITLASGVAFSWHREGFIIAPEIPSNLKSQAPSFQAI